jgi:pyridoxamine 5'-phosphate oxidase
VSRSTAPDPFAAFEDWFSDARAHEPDVPDAMALATASADGRPSVRMVLLKAWGPDGFVFYTNLHSRKARELAANPWACATMHWKSLQRQVVIEGRVEPVADAIADAYWATRPRESQLGGWASDQGAEVAGPDVLVAAYAAAEARFAGVPVPRPPHWSGFRIVPHRVELWDGRPGRMHDRREFRLEGGSWRVRWLSP